MIVHTDRELKFVADRATLKTALALPLPGAVIQGTFSQALKSTYFDTEALELMRHGVSLRVRQSGGKCILGFKRMRALASANSTSLNEGRREPTLGNRGRRRKPSWQWRRCDGDGQFDGAWRRRCVRHRDGDWWNGRSFF